MLKKLIWKKKHFKISVQDGKNKSVIQLQIWVSTKLLLSTHDGNKIQTAFTFCKIFLFGKEIFK